jgi:hypothetical protein
MRSRKILPMHSKRGIDMFQTMEGNARPHRVAGVDTDAPAAESQADLLRALQAASDNVMRLAGKLHADPVSIESYTNLASLHEQQALADSLINRLLAMPAVPA